MTGFAIVLVLEIVLILGVVFITGWEAGRRSRPRPVDSQPGPKRVNPAPSA